MPETPAPQRTRLALATSIAVALGCATPRDLRRDSGAAPSGTSAIAPAAASGPAVEDAIRAVLEAARATLGQTSPEIQGRTLPTDCSGYLRGLYTLAGVDLFSEGRPSDNGVRAIVRWVERHGALHRRKVPAAGDLVFFDNSYDRNRDGRLNDPFTHAGLVEQVLADGTAMIIHATNHGIVREPMNLLRPHEDADADRRPINAPLRRKTARDPAHMPRLMSELFAGFGTVLPRMATSASRL
jgi:cell wall-associated NlpC family hydrolase